MDEPESVIDPLVVENGVDRIRRMGAEERSQLAIQLVRFLAILYAEILRMLQLAEQEEATSLLQMPGLKGTSLSDLKQWVEMGELVHAVHEHEREDEDVNFMQTAVDKFGVLLQKLLGLQRKWDNRLQVSGLLSYAPCLRISNDPGIHITAAIIPKMDRLQALLLSFEEENMQEVNDADREWCFGQWEVLRTTLPDGRRGPAAAGGEQQSASSTDIVYLEDSQEPEAETSGQVAVLSDGSTRPLTREEVEEIAFHEELEAEAAAREAQADEHRWLEFKAQCLREEEDRDMKEAMEASVAEHSHKKARVMLQVEGEGGRVVRSEVFSLVVKEGEALTYKIMVLPKNDPEVRALRRRQAAREDAREGETAADTDSSGSAASADTIRADERGRVLSPPAVQTNEALEEFLKTEEGERYYQKWLKGEITCAMVRERSGCGLLAKFFSLKVDEEEEANMVTAALKAEQAGEEEARLAKDEMGAEGGGLGSARVATEGPKENVGALNASAPWPASVLKEGGEEINLDSQTSQAGAGATGVNMQMDMDTENLNEHGGITEAENRAELEFAIAAGDVPAETVQEEMNDNEDMESGTASAAASTLPTTRSTEGVVGGQSTLKHWLT